MSYTKSPIEYLQNLIEENTLVLRGEFSKELYFDPNTPIFVVDAVIENQIAKQLALEIVDQHRDLITKTFNPSRNTFTYELRIQLFNQKILDFIKQNI